MGSIKQQTRKLKTALILAALATAIFTSTTPFNTASTLPAEHIHEPHNTVDHDSLFTDTSKKTSTTKSTTAASMSDAEKERLLLGLGIRTITKGPSASTLSIASTMSDSEKEKLLLGRAFTTKTSKASRCQSKTDLTLSKSEKKRLLLDLPLLSAQYNIRLGRC
ncbi:MAG: Uncharacterized protein AUREO_063490 [Aureobasidium pullulans]|nr:MAG: Uncharacterized protein AUREO_063490 [Aureobasidium pullulans]